MRRREEAGGIRCWRVTATPARAGGGRGERFCAPLPAPPPKNPASDHAAPFAGHSARGRPRARARPTAAPLSLSREVERKNLSIDPAEMREGGRPGVPPPPAGRGGRVALAEPAQTPRGLAPTQANQS